MKDEATIYAELTDIFRDVFSNDDMVLTPALNAQDVAGWDSFKQIEIIVSAEQKFGIKLNTREIDSLKCVGDLAAVIGRKAA